MMMYDFLRFIDSPDIREFNKDTNFTLAEQAVIGFTCLEINRISGYSSLDWIERA